MALGEDLFGGFGPDGLIKLELPDLREFDLDLAGADMAPEPPASVAGLSGDVFQTLCSRMMVDIHRSHSMSSDEKEASLRKIVLPIPGEPSGRTLKLVEDPAGNFAAGGTGSVVWPASLALIKYLDQEVPAVSSQGAPDIRRSSAVDLGAGLGAVGLFLAVHKGLHVALTEAPESLPLLARSVTECISDLPSKQANKTEVAPLRWGDVTHMAPLGTFDFVLGSDVTYRPECLDDLLTTAETLLAPGGRILFALQDRQSEADQLEVAVERSKLYVLSREAVDVHESEAEFHESAARNIRKGEDGFVKIWLFELMPKEPKTLDAQPVTGSLEDVEAEFERLTGIRPERLRPAEELKRSGDSPPPAGAAAASKSPKKESIIKDMLDRGLGDFLCEMDEDLGRRLEAQRPEARPRTAKQKQAYAEAFYAGREPPPEALPAPRDTSGVGELSPEEATAVRQALGDTAAATDKTAAGEGDGVGGAAAAVDPRAGETGTAKFCLPGLLWDVDINESEGHLTACVSFSETVWLSLQGSRSEAAEGSKAFRQAVDFQLADAELRVLHAGAAVLELELPRPVEASGAVAKICSRKRRVTVKAPLRR